MDIHGLDNSSLLMIFDILAVEDLLRAGRACSRWNFIRAKSALARHSLTLLVSEQARNRIHSSKLDNHESKKDDDEPNDYGEANDDDESKDDEPKDDEAKVDEESNDGDDSNDDDETENICKKCEEDARNTIVRNKISSFNAKFLAHLFPNITNFTVSIKSDIKSVHSLTCLLKIWSTDPKLTTLKLYTFDQRDKSQIAEKTGCNKVSVNRRLLSTINSITSLRVLTFDIDSLLFYVDDDLYVGDVKLDFSPILNRLERLYWYSGDFNWVSDELIDALTQFGNANDNLKEIGINSEQMLSESHNNWTNKISPQLARRFTQMSLRMDDETIKLFSSLCTRFTNLTSLQLALCEHESTFDSTQFFPPIGALTQLTHLTIRGHIRNFELIKIEIDTFDFDEHQNSSVKVLKLRVHFDHPCKMKDGDSQRIIDMLHLPLLFPNLQEIIFTFVPNDIAIL